MTEPMAAQKVRSFDKWDAKEGQTWPWTTDADRINAKSAKWSAWHARDAEIGEKDAEIERLKRVEEFVECTGRARAVLDRAKEAESQIAELREVVRDAQVLLQPVHRYLAGKTRYPGVAYMPVNDWLARATKLLQPQDVSK